MRISDWSSDVCSSDLVLEDAAEGSLHLRPSKPSIGILSIEGVLQALHVRVSCGNLFRHRVVGENRFPDLLLPEPQEVTHGLLNGHEERNLDHQDRKRTRLNSSH